MEDYIRKKTLQGGRHIERAEGALAAARQWMKPILPLTQERV